MSIAPFENDVAAFRMLERCPSVIYVYDVVEQRNVYANRELANILGYTAEDIQAMGAAMFVRLMHPEDLSRLPLHHQKLQAAGDDDVVEIEYRMLHKDGTWRWLISRDVIYSRLADGAMHQYLGIVEDITTRRHALDWAQRALAMVPLLVYVYDLQEQRNVYANGIFGATLGYTPEEIQAMGAAVLPRLMHPDDFSELPATQARIMAAADNEMIETVYRIRRKDGSWTWLQDHVRVFLRDDDGRVRQYMGATQDITARHLVDEERLQLQEQVIAAQQSALRELSTPLIPISDEVMVMPLIGSIDSQRAHQIVEALLQGVSEKRARTVIVDITGVPVVDTHVASALVRAAQAVQLLGAGTVLTGIRPEVAQTLVQMGADLQGLVTRGTLQSGIAHALRRGGA